MSSTKAVYARLVSDAALVAAVGQRIYPVDAPQQDNAVPRIVYAVEDDPDQAEPYEGPVHLRLAKATVAVFAADYPSAEGIASMIRTNLDCADGVWAGKTVQDCWWEAENKHEVVTPDTDKTERVYEQVFHLWYEP